MSGPQPANCAAADTGILLCEITLPSDWLTSAAVGNKTKVGTWSGFGDVAAGSGTPAGHFRLKTNAGTIKRCQGTVTVVGSGGNMTLDVNNIVTGQAVTVASFSITDGNA
jgi:hypothetical protein